MVEWSQEKFIKQVNSIFKGLNPENRYVLKCTESLAAIVASVSQRIDSESDNAVFRYNNNNGSFVFEICVDNYMFGDNYIIQKSNLG